MDWDTSKHPMDIPSGCWYYMLSSPSFSESLYRQKSTHLLFFQFLLPVCIHIHTEGRYVFSTVCFTWITSYIVASIDITNISETLSHYVYEPKK